MKHIITITMKRFILLSILFAAVFCTCCTEDATPIFGDVYGTIINSKTGEPVRNAEVILSPTNATTISGNDGHFEFHSLEAGQYKISVSSDGYEGNSRQITVVPGKSTACDMHLTPKAVVEIFNVDPLTLNFGTTQTQMAVTVTNSSARDTQWSLDLGQNTWLKASPIAGQIGAGKSQTIVFYTNRANLTAETSGIVTFSALGGSSSLTVNCSPSQQVSSIMEVTPLDIDFGDLSTEQIVRIKNKSNALLNWTLFGLDEDAITVSDTSGTIQSGNSKVVAIKLDRSKLSGNHLTTSFMISDGDNDQQVNVNVGSHESNVSESPDQPDTPDNPSTKPVGKLALPSSLLDFGADYAVMPFTISNNGDASLEWSITDVQDDIFIFSPDSGTLEAGNSSEIQISIDRSKLPAGSTESAFAVSDGVNKYIVTVKCEVPEYTDGKIQVSLATLDFGAAETLLNFDIKNVGTTYLSWTATDIPDYITFNYGYHTFKQGMNSTIINRVELNRDMMPDDVDIYITITNDFNPSDTHRVHIIASKQNTSITTDSKIYYTSVDGNVVTPYNTSAFDANIVSNVYENGMGVITFDGELTKIVGRAFWSHTLSTITIPDSVAEIGESPFQGCTSLSAFYGKFASGDNRCLISDGTLVSFAPEGLSSYTIPNNVTKIGWASFSLCAQIKNITIPNSVISIESGAFWSCKSLETITIPNSVENIGEYAFPYCNNLSAFYGKFASDDNRCLIVNNVLNSFAPKGLTSYSIPNNIVKIDSNTISGLDQLQTITIPSSVETINFRSLNECPNLSKVYCESSIPATLGGEVLEGTSTSLKIYVPTSSVEAYKAKSGWSEHADKIVGYDF